MLSVPLLFCSWSYIITTESCLFFITSKETKIPVIHIRNWTEWPHLSCSHRWKVLDQCWALWSHYWKKSSGEEIWIFSVYPSGESTLIFMISNINWSSAGTCLHVNHPYLGCHPLFNKRAASCVSDGPMSSRHFAVDRTWQPQLRSGCLTGQTLVDTEKRRRWGRKRGMTAQMYNSFIHHPSLFSSHHSKAKKKQLAPSFFLSAQMSAVDAWLKRLGKRTSLQLECF